MKSSVSSPARKSASASSLPCPWARAVFCVRRAVRRNGDADLVGIVICVIAVVFDGRSRFVVRRCRRGLRGLVLDFFFFFFFFFFLSVLIYIAWRGAGCTIDSIYDRHSLSLSISQCCVCFRDLCAIGCTFVLLYIGLVVPIVLRTICPR